MSSIGPVLGLRTHPRPSPYPFGPSSVADILTVGLESHPDRIALIDHDRSWTWTELDAAVADVAAGISPGDPLCWDLGNSAEGIIGALATFRAGGIWIGRSSPADREQLLAHLGEVRVISSIDAIPISTVDGEPLQQIDPHGLAAVSFTSGTSGRPKAVAHSQHNLLWPGLVSVETEPPIEGERIGTPLSLGIINILVLGPLSAFLRGSTAVVMDRTYAEGFASDVEDFSVTRTFVVSTMLHDLVETKDVSPSRLTSLDRVIVGGSGAKPELLRSFFDRFSVRPTLSYGLSEAPSGVVRESMDDPIGSGRGFPLPHIEAKIVDGEICLRSATSGPWAQCWTPTLGYIGEPERTDALFSDGLLRTGDTGRIDSDGGLSVTGRLSNMIIRGGANIDPLAIQAAVDALAWVEESLCTGIDDDRLGQKVSVRIVAGAAAPASEELLDALRESIDHPVDDATIVQELPRNHMGKLLRHP